MRRYQEDGEKGIARKENDIIQLFSDILSYTCKNNIIHFFRFEKLNFKLYPTIKIKMLSEFKKLYED